ncbi:MAG: DUF4139 domain-containing protein [Deltaproteobacteria bacterium]|nr:DUF4139 domain-containing protein [Deltaproteobacteria bacterium]
MKHVQIFSLGLGLVLCGACASKPAVTSEGLALKRVVIYRNGVAYFEREGRVTGSKVSFRVRRDEVGDFLASFAVMEKAGGSVRAASFPMRREEPPVRLAEGEKPLPVPPVDPKRKLENVVMELDGGEHDLAVGYIAEAPVWRPSYRLVLQKDKVHLQVWGIVQNLSGEDWKNTHLTVVADAPLALQTNLENAVIPSRPVLAEGNEVIMVVPQSETSLASAPPPPPAPAVAMPEEMADEEAVSEKTMEVEKKEGRARPTSKSVQRSARYRGGVGGLTRAVAPAAPKPMVAPSRTRNLAALAAVAVTGGATRYELPNPVTVPDGSATMLLLLDKEVPGESAFLFAPDPGVPDSAAHPFRVARFRNATGGLLERGPLAFFGEGGFLGQGVIENLPVAASATVPFALEQSLAIERRSEYIEEGSRLFMVDGGQLTIERQVGPRTTYKIKNGAKEARKLWLKHPRQGGSKLLAPPRDTEDNAGTGSALVPVAIGALAAVEAVLNERIGQQQQVDWLSDLAEQAVKGYLADAKANPVKVAALKAAWELRAEWKKLADESERLHAEQQNLERSSEETRDNLRAIEKNKAAEDLRKTLTHRLAKSSARLDQVIKRLIEVDMRIKELELRFREAVKELRIPPAT